MGAVLNLHDIKIYQCQCFVTPPKAPHHPDRSHTDLWPPCEPLRRHTFDTAEWSTADINKIMVHDHQTRPNLHDIKIYRCQCFVTPPKAPHHPDRSHTDLWPPCEPLRRHTFDTAEWCMADINKIMVHDHQTRPTLHDIEIYRCQCFVTPPKAPHHPDRSHTDLWPPCEPLRGHTFDTAVWCMADIDGSFEQNARLGPSPTCENKHSQRHRGGQPVLLRH